MDAISQSTFSKPFSWMKMHEFCLRFHWNLFHQMMAWHRSGDKPLSEPMMVSLLMHICVTRPQWVNSLRPSDANMRHQPMPSLVQIMGCRRPGILLIEPLGRNFSEILIEIYTFSFKKIHLKMSSGKCRPFCLGLNVLTHCGPVAQYGITGVIIGLCPANERQRYFATTSLIGWAQA